MQFSWKNDCYVFAIQLLKRKPDAIYVERSALRCFPFPTYCCVVLRWEVDLHQHEHEILPFRVVTPLVAPPILRVPVVVDDIAYNRHIARLECMAALS